MIPTDPRYRLHNQHLPPTPSVQRQGVFIDTIHGGSILDADHPQQGVNLPRLTTPKRLIADRAYDARKFRNWLTDRGCEPVIPPQSTRKNPHSFDAIAYKLRNRIERMFCRLKDFRRIATRQLYGSGPRKPPTELEYEDQEKELSTSPPASSLPGGILNHKSPNP